MTREEFLSLPTESEADENQFFAFDLVTFLHKETKIVENLSPRHQVDMHDEDRIPIFRGYVGRKENGKIVMHLLDVTR